MTTFACFACGSPAFTIEGILKDETQVSCAECDVPLGSWSVVRHQLQARLTLEEAPRPQLLSDDPVLLVRPL